MGRTKEQNIHSLTVPQSDYHCIHFVETQELHSMENILVAAQGYSLIHGTET